MNNLFLKQVTPYSYAVWGTFTFLQDKWKEVTVDGEVYRNLKREFVTIEITDKDFGTYSESISFEELDKLTWKEIQGWEFDIFENFNLPAIRIYTPRKFDGDQLIKLLPNRHNSENFYAHAIYHLFENPPESWKSFIESHEYKDIENRGKLIDAKLIFDYPVFSYGFNNSIDIELFAHEIVMYNHTEISKKLHSFNSRFCHITKKWVKEDEFSELRKPMTDEQKIAWVNKWVEKLSFYANSALPPDSVS